MTATASAEAGSVALAARCRRVFGPDWSLAEAATLHRQLEQLVDDAERDGRQALADAALALVVFLCSFVEAEQPPSSAALPRIEALAQALAEAAGGAPLPAAPVVARAPNAAPCVLQLAPAQPVHLALAGAIGQLGCLHELVESLPALARALQRRPVDLVLLAPDWVDRTGDVLTTIERHSRGPLSQPETIALLPAEDRARRLFALRAGIDRVLALAEPAKLAEQIGDRLQARRRAAFRVLVVEDDRQQAMFAEAVLRHRGITSKRAASADEAMRLLPEFRPDLVLLDLHLPDRNGIELAQMLRERPELDYVQIVFLSGEPSMEEHFRAIRLGGDDWVSKPVTPRQLLAVIDSRAERARRLHPQGGSQHALMSRERFVDTLDELLTRERDDLALVALAPLEPPRPGDDDFVGQERWSEQIAGQLLSLSTLSLGLCRPEPFLFLFIAIDDQRELLSERLQALHADLEQRAWGGARQRQPFALAAVALPPQAGSERWLRDALAGLERARADADHRRLLELPASSRRADAGTAPSAAEGARFARCARLTFQPLVPVTGHLPGRFAVQPALDTPLSPAEQPRFDRWLLTGSLERIRAAQADGQPLRLLVPIALITAEDAQFAAWLGTELRRLGCSGDSLVVRLDPADPVATPGRLERAIQTLAGATLRVALGPLRRGPEHARLCTEPALGWVVLDAGDEAALAGGEPGSLLAIAREYGKFVLVTGIVGTARLPALFASDLHYVAGDAIAPALPEPRFEFPDG